MSGITKKHKLYQHELGYLNWMIDFFNLEYQDLKKVVKFVEDITESYHDPYR